MFEFFLNSKYPLVLIWNMGCIALFVIYYFRTVTITTDQGVSYKFNIFFNILILLSLFILFLIFTFTSTTTFTFSFTISPSFSFLLSFSHLLSHSDSDSFSLPLSLDFNSHFHVHSHFHLHLQFHLHLHFYLHFYLHFHLHSHSHSHFLKLKPEFFQKFIKFKKFYYKMVLCIKWRRILDVIDKNSHPLWNNTLSRVHIPYACYCVSNFISFGNKLIHAHYQLFNTQSSMYEFFCVWTYTPMFVCVLKE